MTYAEEKRLYLVGIDNVLQPLSFRRRKNGQEWQYRIDDRNELWVHLNFGKAVVNPSFGVTYLDFDSLIAKEIRSVSGTFMMLSRLLPATDTYLVDDGPDAVARNLLDKGLPFLSRLSDRAFAIELLASETVRDWPALSYSDRIRLLPLLLAAENRVAEACQVLKRFLAEALPRDQIIPGYDVFANAFVARFAC